MSESPNFSYDINEGADPYPQDEPYDIFEPSYNEDAPDISAKQALVDGDIEFRKLLLKTVERELQQQMTVAKHAVLSFIVDRTIRYNKFWERVSIRQICRGLKDRHGNYIHCGINISERHAHRVIHSLLDKQFICRRERFSQFSRGDFDYAYHFDDAIAEAYLGSDD